LKKVLKNTKMIYLWDANPTTNIMLDITKQITAHKHMINWFDVATSTYTKLQIMLNDTLSEKVLSINSIAQKRPNPVSLGIRPKKNVSTPLPTFVNYQTTNFLHLTPYHYWSSVSYPKYEYIFQCGYHTKIFVNRR